MNNNELKIEDDMLNYKEMNNFHIEKVQVFTGDDDYNETSAFELKSKKENESSSRLWIKEVVPSKENPGRLRHEPGVRLYLDSEIDGKKYVLQINHHKGLIIFSMKEGK